MGLRGNGVKGKSGIRMELGESQVNLKINKMKPLVDTKIVEPVLDECSQLVAIFTIIKNKKDNRKG